MAASTLDVSGLLEAASVPTVEVTPQTTTEETPLEVPEGETPPESTETGEVKTETGAAPTVDARTNPDAIRKVLKELRDSSPEKAPIARRLNDIVGHEQAYRAVFPKVADAKNAKFLLESIGGGEGLSALQQTIKSVNETDALLYAGDGKVLNTLYDDMKAAGHPEALGKLAGPYLELLRERDDKAYFAALRPHFFQGIVDSGLPDVLGGLEEALAAQADGKPAPNVELMKALVGEMRRWYNGLDHSVKTNAKSALDPDRQALAKERQEFQTEKQKAFHTEVNTDWNRANNKALGAALAPYLKMQFTKNWTDATRHSVAREITSTLLSELGGDKAYQAQMDAFWSDPKPDKGKIVAFHQSKLDLVAKRIVADVLNARYPGFTGIKAPAPNGGKPPVAQGAAQTGKPVFQTMKPKHDDVDWDRDPNQFLYITGRFYDKRGNFKTWNPKYKG
jgi:hypothetical protein